jgi:hypothetical protein
VDFGKRKILHYSKQANHDFINNMESKEFIFSRHAKRTREKTPDGEKSEYLGITKEGEMETRKNAKDVAEIIDNLPEKSVIVLGGVSGAVRTRSTIEIYADELKKIFKGRKDVNFPMEGLKGSLNGKLKKLKELSESETDKKSIIEFPLWIKQFTASPEKWQEWFDFYAKIGKSGDKKSDIPDWMEKKIGPDPEKVAKDFIKGLSRENNFFKKFFPDNTIAFVNVDHSGELDALFTYLANNGIVSKEGFEKIGNKEVKESEISELIFPKDGEINFKYRDNTYICPPETLKSLADNKDEKTEI